MYTYKVETYMTFAGLKKEKEELENEKFEAYLNEKEKDGWTFQSFAFFRNNGGEVCYKVIFRKEK